MILNTYRVRKSVWSKWDDHGREVFNDVYQHMFYVVATPATGWNTAFFAACEASRLNIEFEPKGGWK